MPTTRCVLDTLQHIKNSGYGEFVVKNDVSYDFRCKHYIGYLHTIAFCDDTVLISDNYKYNNRVTVCELISLMQQAGGRYVDILVNNGEEGCPTEARTLWNIIVNTREKAVYLCNNSVDMGEAGCKHYYLNSAHSQNNNTWFLLREF